jgi:hypothetical protein
MYSVIGIGENAYTGGSNMTMRAGISQSRLGNARQGVAMVMRRGAG